MSAFDLWVLKVKRRETTGARLAHDAYRRLQELELPETPLSRGAFRAVYFIHEGLVDVGEWAAGKFLFEPMLRARSASCGKRLRLSSLPYIRGHVRITIGDDCNFAHFGVRAGRFVDNPELVIGSGCTFGSDVSFTVNKRVTVGDHVGIASRVTIQDSDSH